MGRNFAGLWDRDRFGEEKAAPVARVANALGYRGAPSQPGGVEGILEEKRCVELLRAQALAELFSSLPAAMFAFRVIRDELIADGLITIDVGYVGSRDDCDVRVWEFCAHGT